jgi:outer membrane autotransporter protein
VDVKGVSVLSGLAGYLKPTWMAGFFAEAGWGDYSSFNDFDEMASIHAKGNSHYYGGGLLTRNDWDNGWYVDSALRAGQVETQYDSTDLFYLTSAHYKTTALYFGAQAGAGYEWEMRNDFLLDLSARYLWNRQNSNKVSIAGDPTEINLQAINSHRARAQAKLSYQGDLFSPFITMAYDNEFDGYAKAQVLGAEVPAPSLAGGTAIGGVGIHIQSNKNSRSYVNVRAQGFLGQRKGYSAAIEAGWVF